jgi:hypothetical protein
MAMVRHLLLPTGHASGRLFCLSSQRRTPGPAWPPASGRGIAPSATMGGLTGRPHRSAALLHRRLSSWVNRRPHYTVRSASVGDMRAARRAGSRPARAPMAMAEPMLPAQARTGMTTAQPRAVA